MVTRAEQTASFALLITAVYLSLLSRFVELPDIVQNQIVPYIPAWAIMSFGAFLLGKLGFNVMTFNDVPEAHKELMAEIDEAKTDLRRMGVDVD